MVRWVLVLLFVCNIGGVLYSSFFPSGVEGGVRAKKSMLTHETILLLDEAIASSVAVKYGNGKDSGSGFAQQSQLCTQIGAFRTHEMAEQVRQRLMTAAIGSDLKEVKVLSGLDYLIYIPPFGSKNQALRALRMLQAAKVQGHVMTEGELINGISLGQFTNRKQAEQLLVSRMADGYEVELKEVRKFRNDYWVEIHKDDLELLSDKLWENIHSKYKFVEKMDNLCDSTVAR